MTLIYTPARRYISVISTLKTCTTMAGRIAHGTYPSKTTSHSKRNTYTPSFFIGILNALDTAGNFFCTIYVQNVYLNKQLPLLAKCKQLQVR